MTSYLDTSFLWKLYVNEAHSDRVLAWFSKRRSTLVISDLSDVEMTSALYRRLSPERAAHVRSIYEGDKADGAFIQVQMDRDVFLLAEKLAEDYAGKFGLRSLDALHLAVTLRNEIDILATFDEKLKRAAAVAGLGSADLGV